MRAGVLGFLVAFSVVGLLKGDTVTYSVTPTAGQFEYLFTLTNTGTTGGALFDLFLAIPTDITSLDTGSIGRPLGWGDAAGGLLFFGPDANPSTSFIQWAADFSGVYDIAIGRSLSGYSFLSSEQIGSPIQFSLNGSLSLNTAEEVTPIPEPSALSLIVFASGVSLCCRTAVRRKTT